jgi:hypothetical protein
MVSNTQAATIASYRGYAADSVNWPECKVIITFFREPFYRAVSAYLHFFKRGVEYGKTERTSVHQVFAWRDSFEEAGFHPDMDFTEFCYHLPCIDPSCDNHLKPQFVSLREALDATGAASEEMPVHGAQLEQINIIWPILVDQYGLVSTKTIAHFNTRVSGTPVEYYEHRDLINNLYTDDFTLWNLYKFEAGTTLSSVSH